MKYRRNREIALEGNRVGSLRPVLKLGEGYYISLPVHWIKTWCIEEDMRVTLEPLEDEPGYVVRPFQGGLTQFQPTLPLGI